MQLEHETEDRQTHLTGSERLNLILYGMGFLLLLVFLVVMLWHPLRILVNELCCDYAFYGGIAIGCILIARYLQRRYDGRGRGIIIAAFICAVLAGWQVFDLAVLRLSFAFPRLSVFAPPNSGIIPPDANYDGFAYYSAGISHNREILCHMIFETYRGTNVFAITLEIDRKASWFACGG